MLSDHPDRNMVKDDDLRRGSLRLVIGLRLVLKMVEMRYIIECCLGPDPDRECHKIFEAGKE